MRAFPILTALVLAACGGDDAPKRAGDQSFTPPPMSSGDGERPSDSTDVTCQIAEDCGYWFCRCDDGAVVNSALCVNGYCMDAASACPDACAAFDHGDWTGIAGGGPRQDPEPDPPSDNSCGELSHNDPSCDGCFRDQCCAQGEACGQSNACLDYWDCADTCAGDFFCLEDCDISFPGGRPLFEALDDCLASACYDECGAL